MGARDPALLESMTIVPGTRRDSKEGEEGKANDLFGHKFFRKVVLESAPSQFGGSLVVDAKSWRSRADRRCKATAAVDGRRRHLDPISKLWRLKTLSS